MTSLKALKSMNESIFSFRFRLSSPPRDGEKMCPQLPVFFMPFCSPSTTTTTTTTTEGQTGSCKFQSNLLHYIRLQLSPSSCCFHPPKGGCDSIEAASAAAFFLLWKRRQRALKHCAIKTMLPAASFCYYTMGI